jgi:hypothetical protein|tara:strand:- start:465 stop:698 length:234 start_codon:yes stop_codon:yes gene_type:complete
MVQNNPDFFRERMRQQAQRLQDAMAEAGELSQLLTTLEDLGEDVSPIYTELLGMQNRAQGWLEGLESSGFFESNKDS